MIRQIKAWVAPWVAVLITEMLKRDARKKDWIGSTFFWILTNCFPGVCAWYFPKYLRALNKMKWDKANNVNQGRGIYYYLTEQFE